VEAVKERDSATVRSLLKQHIDVNTPEPDGATALAWAAHWDDLDTAELLIHAGANVNAANDYGVTPLSLACTNGNSAMIEKLLKAGANPNATLPTGETPLMTASRTGNVDSVKLLLEHGADANAKEIRRGQTALMWAVAEGHPEVARVLIERGADVHTRSKSGFTPLLFTAQQGNVESARILLAAGANINEATPDDGSALVVASASGHEALSIFLLDKGADPNVADGRGITALHYAMLQGISLLDNVWYEPFRRDQHIVQHVSFPPFRPNMPELVKTLLARGANPNARIAKDPQFPTSYISYMKLSTTPVGATPFMLAAATYDVDLMRALVASGADPLLTTEEKTTPVIMAAGLGARLCGEGELTEEEARMSLEAVKLAVELGGDVNATNNAGLTALHAAAYLGSDAVIAFLVDKGANVNAKDKNGQTALTIAEKIVPPTLFEEGLRPRAVHKTTADLLRKLGATPLAAATARPIDSASSH
jgi:ankyrin repeat protein